MKVVVFGASGVVGRCVVQEALRRGCDVSAVCREPARLNLRDERLRTLAGDATDAAGVAGIVRGRDAVISTVGPTRGSAARPVVVVDAARALIAGLGRAGVRRLVVLGGAGSLQTRDGVRLFDTPGFTWLDIAYAHYHALDLYRASDLDWTVVSPAGSAIRPGERTGRYRTGADELIVGPDGQSRISAEDCAVALLDEIESPRHLRQRMSIGY